jgi:hypothetical protein
LGTTIAALLADGWTVTRANQDGTEIPFDIATLPGLIGSDGVTFLAHRGSNSMGVFYTTDAATSQFFGAGTFIIAVPLVVEAPLPSGTTANDPSTISDLKTIADSAPNPVQSGVLVVTASLLTLLLGIPAYLLSIVLSKRYDQWFGWLDQGRIGTFRKQLSAADSGTARRRWIFLAVGMVLAAFIACFVDPQFGLNGMSLRLFLTLLVTFVVFNVGAWGAITLVLRRVDPAARPTLRFHPATIVAVALAVLLSRLLDFNPGIVFGLVAGVTFAVTLVLSKEAIVIIAGSGYAAAVALVAWIAYSIMNAGGPVSGVIPVSISEFFGSITLEGVSTLPIALIPLATLDGGVLFRWKKWVWAVSYAAGIIIFMLVLFTVPGGDQPIGGDFLRWIVIFAAFAVIAVGVWLADWLVRTGRIGRSAPPAAT